ncbi:MAG: nucleoid-associated protein [Saprospiraceae bacterium]
MINRKEVILAHVSVHLVGNEQEGIETIMTSSPIDISEEQVYQQLLSYFLDQFKEPEFYQFLPVGDTLENNFMYRQISVLTDENSDFHSESIHIVKWLINQSTHHYIKSGELLVFQVKNVLVEDEMMDAIGVFKVDNKDSFLSFVQDTNGNISVECQNGIHTQKLDKACIIFNTDQEVGYKILNIDHSNRFKDAKYWREDFLHITPRIDAYQNTKQYIQLTKEFVNERLPKQFDADKTAQVQVMQRSLDYFQKAEQFESQEYASKIFKDDKIVEAFQEFKGDYENYKQIELYNEFDISDSAVKKQSRVFKSIIKLDKNFHIYVHGNRNMIEKGTADDGRKYYVLYYDEEH